MALKQRKRIRICTGVLSPLERTADVLFQVLAMRLVQTISLTLIEEQRKISIANVSKIERELLSF